MNPCPFGKAPPFCTKALGRRHRKRLSLQLQGVHLKMPCCRALPGEGHHIQGHTNWLTCASASWTAGKPWLASSTPATSSWLVLCCECVPSKVFWSLDKTVLKSDAEGIVGRLGVTPNRVNVQEWNQYYREIKNIRAQQSKLMKSVCSSITRLFQW